MSRARIESLLASFPKLIPTGTQHTSVETADVRYVYQPLEDLYILLITNKASNILQDIETLHLFARVVSDLCRSAEQREILKNAFELLSAFDEIVSLGYREQVNLMQVRNVLEMESHEEKIQEIIARVRPYPHFVGYCSLSDMFTRGIEQGGGSKGGAQTPRQAARDAASRAAKACSCRWSVRRKLPWWWHFWLLCGSPARVQRPYASTYSLACAVEPTYTCVQGERYEAWC